MADMLLSDRERTQLAGYIERLEADIHRANQANFESMGAARMIDAINAILLTLERADADHEKLRAMADMVAGSCPRTVLCAAVVSAARSLLLCDRDAREAQQHG